MVKCEVLVSISVSTTLLVLLVGLRDYRLRNKRGIMQKTSSNIWPQHRNSTFLMATSQNTLKFRSDVIGTVPLRGADVNWDCNLTNCYSCYF